jgi:hypothetical protein
VVAFDPAHNHTVLRIGILIGQLSGFDDRPWRISLGCSHGWRSVWCVGPINNPALLGQAIKCTFVLIADIGVRQHARENHVRLSIAAGVEEHAAKRQNTFKCRRIC